VMLLFHQIYWLLIDPKPPTRLDAFYIANSIAAIWFFLGQLHNDLMAARRRAESSDAQSGRWKSYKG
jgi:hypothetical protein